MGIGVSVFLIAAGAILAFAVNDSVSGVNLVVIGWILMGAGVLGFLMSLAVFGPRRRRSASRTVVQDDSYAAQPGGASTDQPGGRRVVREDTYNDTV